jgi:mannose-6-phosphate isomerase-like protein (cupin superfamily)
VRLLLELGRGGLAHFELAAGETSVAVHHRSIEEIWYFIAGEGEMWRSNEHGEDFRQVQSGLCLTIPRATHFQFRAHGSEPLQALGITMPPWPGEGEAIRSEGPWVPTVSQEPGLADV